MSLQGLSLGLSALALGIGVARGLAFVVRTYRLAKDDRQPNDYADRLTANKDVQGEPIFGDELAEGSAKKEHCDQRHAPVADWSGNDHKAVECVRPFGCEPENAARDGEQYCYGSTHSIPHAGLDSCMVAEGADPSRVGPRGPEKVGLLA